MRNNGFKNLWSDWHLWLCHVLSSITAPWFWPVGLVSAKACPIATFIWIKWDRFEDPAWGFSVLSWIGVLTWITLIHNNPSSVCSKARKVLWLNALILIANLGVVLFSFDAIWFQDAFYGGNRVDFWPVCSFFLCNLVIHACIAKIRN